MKKKVIALKGKGSVGKSQTIKRAYDLLKFGHPGSIEEHRILTKVDVRVVLTIKGAKIGIESQGDPGGRLKQSLSLFANAGCMVIICATRTYGQTVDAVNGLHPAYEVLWLKQTEKSSEPEQQANNNAMAQRIVEEVEKVIGV